MLNMAGMDKPVRELSSPSLMETPRTPIAITPVAKIVKDASSSRGRRRCCQAGSKSGILTMAASCRAKEALSG